MPGESRAVVHFRRSRTVTDLSPGAGEYAVRRYQEAQAALDEFDHRYRLMLHRYAPCRLYPRQRLANFGRHVYGLNRRLVGERLLEQAARDAVKWVGPDTGPDRLAGAARIALELAGRVTPETDEQWICRRIDEIRRRLRPRRAATVTASQ